MAIAEKCRWNYCKNDYQYDIGAGVSPKRNLRKASLFGTVVREVLQNSIDAAVEYPVRVKI